MWAIGLISFVALLQILPHYSAAQGESSCVNPLGKNGRCINIRQCDSLLKLLLANKPESNEFLRSSLCGYEGNDPKVCCPDEATPVTNTKYGPLLSPDCGISYGEHGRIVNGVPATLGSWPWVAALGYRDARNSDVPKFRCGGSLVSARHVITAGHCLYDQPDLYMVRLGDLDLNSTTDGADPIDVLIEKKILHPNYDPNYYTSDVAVLRLAEDVPFSRNLHPICLPVPEKVRNYDVEGTFPFIAGWGSVYFNGPSSSHLLELQIPIVDHSTCKNAFKSFGNAVIDERILCAGFARGGKDACQGDSGGPLMVPQNKSYYLFGVVSYGFRCAEPGYPGVYSKVTYFLDFILQNLV